MITKFGSKRRSTGAGAGSDGGIAVTVSIGTLGGSEYVHVLDGSSVGNNKRRLRTKMGLLA